MAPRTRWATRRPMSFSGYTTCGTPSCSRIWPCASLTAFAHNSSTPSLISNDVVRMLDWMSLPIATTTRSNSGTDSCLSASSRVESAITTCVSWPFRPCTMSSLPSIPSTSVPLAINSSASARPNLPRPMTATESAAAIRPRSPRVRLLANDGPLFRELVHDGALAEGERGGERDGAESSDEHQHDEDELRRHRQPGGDTGREADR